MHICLRKQGEEMRERPLFSRLYAAASIQLSEVTKNMIVIKLNSRFQSNWYMAELQHTTSHWAVSTGSSPCLNTIISTSVTVITSSTSFPYRYRLIGRDTICSIRINICPAPLREEGKKEWLTSVPVTVTVTTTWAAWNSSIGAAGAVTIYSPTPICPVPD